MEDVTGAARKLHELRKLRVHIALDDFGTGYSSLSYLTKLPADSLKIDGSFIDDLSDDETGSARVAAMIAMAQNLGLRVVAECVETKKQLRRLCELNCDEVQGFPFRHPLPADEIPALLREGGSAHLIPGGLDEEDVESALGATGSFDSTGNLVHLHTAGNRRPQ